MKGPVGACESAFVDTNSGLIVLDGEQFPFWVTDDVTVEGLSADEITVLRLGVYVSGLVVILDSHGKRTVVDRELGDVGAWARNYVRERFQEAFPWLVTS